MEQLGLESTWPFKPEHIGVNEAGEFIPTKIYKGSESLMQGDPREVNPINDSANSSSECGLDYVLGDSNKTNCSNTVDHFLLVDPIHCHEAARSAGVTSNTSGFYIESEEFYLRPKGCFALPCSQDPNGICYYYNNIQNWPDVTDSEFRGRPVCSRQKFLNGTRTAGTRNPDDNPGGCPAGYSDILDNATCMGVASCKTYCVGVQFVVDVMNYSKHDQYPQGCFIHEVDGCVYFKPPDANLPQNPRGMPVCNVSTSLHFPEAGEKISKVTYANPVLVGSEHELADPAFLDDRTRTQKFYIYPTGDQNSYDIYQSQDLVAWTKGPKVLAFDWPPCPIAFAFGKLLASATWAPDVFFDTDSQRYYIYYTRCLSVGVAVSDSPLGPFADLGILVRWAIDAHLFKDSDGRMYLYYAHANFLRFFSGIQRVSVQPMENATHVASGTMSKEVLIPSQPWEFLNSGWSAPRGVNEAPWMVKLQDTYYLMYSGGGADSKHYAIGYATSNSPIGPFTKFAANPITVPGPNVFGPGHHAIWQADDGQLWCIYHIKKSSRSGWDRFLAMDPVHKHADGSLSINNTVGIQQPAPNIASR